MTAKYKITIVEAIDLLNEHWESFRHVGSCLDCWEELNVEIRLTDGTSIFPEIGCEYHSNYAYDTEYCRPGETVEEALIRTGRSLNDVQYVILNVRGHEDVAGRPLEDYQYKEFIGISGKSEAAAKLAALEEAARRFLDKEIGFSQFKELVKSL